MRFKDWTVKELVVFLTGNALFGKVGDSVLDCALRDERGLVSGELLFRVNPQKLVDKNESEETEMKYEIHPDGTMTLNPAYTEILRLDKMLTEKGIDHKTERLYDGYRVGVNYDGREIGDAVEHYFSYGNEENLLETMGFGEYDVTGRRTAEDVMTVIESAIERKRGQSDD